MEKISDLILSSPKEKGTHRSERGDLIDFFHSQIRDKKFKKYPISRIAVKLSHLSVKDLYYLQSVFKDISVRKGIEGAQKFWWWSLRPKK